MFLIVLQKGVRLLPAQLRPQLKRLRRLPVFSFWSIPLSQSWSFGWRFILLWFQPYFFIGKSFHTCSGSSMWRAGPLQMSMHPGDKEGSSVVLLMLINKGDRDQFLMPMPRGMTSLTFIWLRTFPWWNEVAVNIPTLGFLWDTGTAPEI